MLTVFAFLALLARAQDTGAAPSPAADAAAANQWHLVGSAAGYLIPHNRSYINPSLVADRNWLHLEGRYNNEDMQTGSLWAGYNFTLSDKLGLKLTPMIGGVFGKKNGIAPGYQWIFDYKKVALFTQGEFVFDLQNRAGSYFYTWSELSYSPLEWLRAGIVAQRTKAYQTTLGIQRGVLVGVSFKKMDLTAYVFNMGWADPMVVISVGRRF